MSQDLLPPASGSSAGDVAHDAADSGNPVKIGGYAKAAAPTDVSADGDRVNAWLLRNGAQAVVLSAAGALIGGDATNGLDVDVTRVSGTVAVAGTFWQATQPVSGTLTASEAKTEDAAASNGDSGIPMLGVRNDAQTVKTSTDGDYGMLSLDDVGRARVTVDAMPTVTVTGTVTANAGSGTRSTGGDTAHDAVDSGSPVKVGGYAKAAAPADVSADGDRVNAWLLRNGAQAAVLTAAGALIGGDAANGLDVDVTRLPALPAGTNNIGDVDVLTVPAPLSTAGGGTEAAALRVTLANDSTGLVSVDDNGGSVTVDAPIGTPVNAQIGDGTRTATVRDTGANDSLNVAIVDGSGNQITSFGGGTQYTEDVALAANAATGTLLVARRDDALSTLTPVEDDAVGARVNSRGALWVAHDGAAAVTGTFWQATQPVAGDAAHDAADTGNPQKIGGYAKAAAPTDVSADGDRVNAWFLRSGAQAMVLTAGGVLIPGDATNGLDVDVTRFPTRTVDVNATLTRPADTTAYADGDSVSSSTSAPTILTFSNCAQTSGGTGMIVAATMRDSAYSATPGTFELWLLDTTTTPDNDNAAFTPTDGEVDTCVAVIKFSLIFPGDKTAGATGNMLYQATGLNIPFVTAGSANLFGIVVVRGAYTPISAETFKFRLKILQD